MIKDIIIRTRKGTPVTQNSLWGWGDGTLGQTDNSILSYVPTPVDAGTSWVSGSAGGSHTIAIKSDGTIWSWGLNSSGQLGLGDATLRSSPVQVGGLTNWSVASAGVSHIMSIKNDGTLWFMGGNITDNTSGLYSYKLTPNKVGTTTDWSSISVGPHMMAIKSNATLWGWGKNTYGQIGDGTITQRLSPVQIGSSTDWYIISAGAEHTVGVKTDNTLWSWGHNNFGQLGDNTTVNRSSPIQIGTLSNWSKVSAGNSYTMAVKTDGTLWGWGRCFVGQIGDNTTIDKSSPIQIGTLTNWSDVSIGGFSSYGLKTDGTIWSWGSNGTGELGQNNTILRSSPVQIGTLSGWSSIVATQQSAHAIRTDGTLWSWGYNGFGNLGDNSVISRSSPVQVGTLTTWSSVYGGGFATSYGLQTNGTLWGWGVSSTAVSPWGQVGDGTTTNRSTPVQIGGGITWSKLPTDSGIGDNSFTSTRDGVGAAINSSGELYLWGANSFGQQASENTLDARTGILSFPVQLGLGTDWYKVSAGNLYTIAIKSNGTLWGWGSNVSGQLGSNTTSTLVIPTQIGTGTNWSKISSGYSHTMAIKTDGTLWGWGTNGNGELGNEPITPTILNGDVWSDTDGGFSYTMGIKSNGTLWGWGLGTNNELGIETSISPIQLGSETNWKNIFLGNANAFSIKTDNTLWSWGRNDYGELGDGTVTYRSSPVQIGTTTDWSFISCGSNHTLALKSDGTLWSWGRNNLGQLGQNLSTTINRSSPVQVGTLSGWTKIDAGPDHSLAIRSNGTLWSWGSGDTGKLGTGVATALLSSPVQIGTLTVWANIAAGARHSNFVRTDGTLWGVGDFQLAYPGFQNFSPGYYSSPIQIGSINEISEITTKNIVSHALGTGGRLWSWGAGNNVPGQVGNGLASTAAVTEIGTPSKWTKVSAGGNSSLAIRNDGTLWGWGVNTNGQVGDSTGISRSSPVQIGTRNDWIDIDAGWSSASAIDASNRLYVWGLNTSGQLGLNNTSLNYASSYSSPMQVGTETIWSKVSTANAFSIGKKTDGTLWSWGNNSLGQLGLNDTTTRLVPTFVGDNFDTFGSFNSHTMAIKTDGTLYGWGLNTSGELGNEPITPTRLNIDSWSDTDGGYSYTMGIKSNGTLWGWGLNTSGQLGIRIPIIPYQIGTGSDWSTIAAGGTHNFAIKTNGTAWSWGTNTVGNLGHGNNISRSSPTQIGTDTNWVSGSLSISHTIALRTNNTMWGWGRNNSGQLGDATVVDRPSPVQIGGTSDWTRVGAGGNSDTTMFSMAVKTDGSLWGWGSSVNGKIGINRTFTPQQIDIATNWYDISGGGAHSLAIKTNGTLWSWGYNGYGQLGDGTTVNKNSPIQIGTLTTWSKAFGTYHHSYAIKTDGTLWSWGYNNNGQLGLGDIVSRSSPVQVGTLTDWLKVQSGGDGINLRYAVIGLRSNGTIWTWGFGGLGESGQGVFTNYSSPVQVGTLTGWTDVASGGSNQYAIRNGGLWAWGQNSNGSLGLNNTTASINSPVQVGTLTDWLSVNTGGGSSSVGTNVQALKTDGTLWGWGSNTYYVGYIGDNTIISRSSPVQIGTRNGWSSVLTNNAVIPPDSDSIGRTSLAIRTDGTLWAWGPNNEGNVGDGSITWRSSPIQIGTDMNWAKISSGGAHNLAMKTDGTLWVWGFNCYGQLGLGNNLCYTNSTPLAAFNIVNQSSPARIQLGTNWSQLSLGYDHSAATKTDGTLWTWGVNGGGQIGDGTVTTRSSPIQIGTLTGWSKVSAGASHTMAIYTDGTLWGWGLGTSGQLGQNGVVSRSSPVQVGTLTSWKDVYAGNTFTLATRTDGTLWAWGVNTNGNLGGETFVSRSSPVQVGTRNDWASSAIGSTHTLGLDTAGKMYGWGLNSSGQLGFGDTVVYSATGMSSPTQVGSGTDWSKISTAAGFTIGKKTDGTLWSWGTNSAGQLGLNNTIDRWSPVQIGTGTDWNNFSSFTSRVFAIKTDGSIWSWGGNASGQLGDGTVIERSSPTQIGTLTNWSKVSAGDVHTLSVKTDGTLWSWGGNASGQLGQNISTAINRSSPVQIGTLTNWSKVSAGLSHSMAVKTDGTLWGWGGNGSGELGSSYIPTQISIGSDWSTLAMSNYFDSPNTYYASTIAVKTNGTLWSWGSNTSGELGDNTTVSLSSPVQIGTLSDWLNSKISGGDRNFILVKSNGTLWAWGNGTVGDGTGESRSSPVQIGTLNTWSNVSTNALSFFAISTNGALWGWGRNTSGQLGLNDTTQRNSPVQIGTLTNWSKVATGMSHTVAVKTDGTLWTWGRNNLGQLGDNTVTNKSSPVQIGTLTNWSDIWASNNAVFATKTDGTLWGWGQSAGGSIGDNTLTDRSSPVQIGTQTNWLNVKIDVFNFGNTAAVSGQQRYVIAVKSDRTLWSWGRNAEGQLGNGLGTDASSPIQIGTDVDWDIPATGGRSVIVKKTNGTIWGWGENTTGDILLPYNYPSYVSGVSSPIQIGTLTTWSDVWATNARTYATKTDGTLWGWGAATNYLGDTLASNVGLGTFPTTPTTRYSPVQIGTRTNWSSTLGRGQNHITALKTDGTLWGWGLNVNGQLGLNFFNSNTNRSSPVQIGEDSFWSTASTGQNHTLSVKTDGTLWGWGFNSSGQIGNSSVVSRSYPVQIGTRTGWSKVSAGLSHSMGIRTDGTLWGWGGDGSGELGIRGELIVPKFLSGDWSVIHTSEFVAASSFNSTTFSIKTDGTLWGWGANTSGQIGDVSVINRSSPVQIGTNSDWSKITNSISGNSLSEPIPLSTWGIKTDGTLWAWGNNSSGELGLGTATTSRSSPVQIGTLTNWLDVSGFSVSNHNGTGGVIALKNDGTLWSWGFNFYGTLGLGDTGYRNSPVQVGTLTNWSTIDASSGPHVLAVKTDGTLWAWGGSISTNVGQIGDGFEVNRSSPVQIGTLTNWSKVSAGRFSSFAIKTDGTLWSWGSNNGNLGDGTSTNRSSPVQIGTLTDWSSVSAGTSHTMAIKVNGTLWAWGNNVNGQFGNGTFTSVNSPVQIGTMTHWSKVSAGYNYTIATTTNGDLYVWGRNDFGQLGLNNTIGGQTTSLSSPIQIGTLTTWSDVWATNARTYATKTDGTLWGWGAATNYLGDTLASNVGLGTFPTTPTTRYSPVQIGTKTNWSEIGRGQNHIIGLKTDGSMLGWGINTQGQLGLNFFSSNTNRSSPVQIGDDTFWSEVAAGQNHTLAVKTDGTLWGWGLGTGGRIGDGQVISRSYPVQIGTLTSWSKVNANVDHSVAITTSGNLWGWGTNTTGKLGDGTIISRSSPVQLPGTGWKDVNGVGSHSIGVSTAGNLYTWGLATSGQLGYSMQRSSPVQIGTLVNWSSIDAGDLAFHTMGIKTNGTLWGWGTNNLGQLGDNTVVYKGSPTQIGTRTEWSSVNLSISHTMALRTDYTLWGWGRNVSGQIGDGTATDRSSPVQVGTTSDWSKVSAGGNSDTTMFTMGIKTDGSLWGWGSITNGKVPIFTTAPQLVDLGTNWSVVSAHQSHTMSIKTDGTLWGWGGNQFGQLGQNNTANRSSPVQIGTLPEWSVVSCHYHTISIKTDGTLWGWGINNSRELGDGTITLRSSPVQIGTMNDWAKVAAGSAHSLAIKTNGTLWSWGTDFGGSLGANSTATRISPVQIGTLTNWANVFAFGVGRGMAIKTDGTLWIWGRNDVGQIGDGTIVDKSSPVQIGTFTDWSNIAAGSSHTIAVRTNGTLWGWGLNNNGQLGQNNITNRSSPVQIGTLTDWSNIACGDLHTIGLKTNGTLWGWGRNTTGQIGNESITSVSSPVQIGTLTNWSKFSAGTSYTIAITNSGNLYSWGSNTNGELGLSHTISQSTTTQNAPVRVQLGTNWSTLSLGADHGMATKTDGTLWGWGLNGNGQIGDGSVTTRSSPIQIGTLTGWSKVSAGASHTMAIYTDNTLWTWGLGTSGQLGYDTIVPSRLTPTNDWSNIGAGTSHSISIRSNGTIWAFGANSVGQLGDNTVISRSSPIQIGTLTNWSKVFAGGAAGLTDLTIAIKTDGTLWSWGSGNSGMIGDGTVINRSSPVQIGTMTNWSLASVGQNFVLSIKTDGTLWGWGESSSNGSDVNRSSPVQIGNGNDWYSVATGARHAAAIKTNGTLWGWGNLNSFGQIGDGTTTGSKSSPIQIGTLTNWSKISAGTSHTMAVKNDGTLWTWGNNLNGQLGDNTVIDKSSPIQIGTLTDWADVISNSSANRSFALKTNGTLWAWGRNNLYQLGDGTNIDRSSPVQIGTLTNWSKISIGLIHSISIKGDSSLWGWGSRTNGQLSSNVVNATTSISSPIQVGEDQWSSVYAGNLYTTAIKTNGTLWAWGVNTAGFLGDASVISRSAPVQIGSRSGWTQVSAGASHTIAIYEE